MPSLKVPVCYGVDLGDTHVAVVRAARRPSGPVSEVLLDAPWPNDRWPALAAEIRMAVENRRAGARVALAVRDVVHRRLSAPFSSVCRARRVLPSLLDTQLPFPLEQCVSEYLDLRAAGGRAEALAVAALKESLEERLAACVAAGIDPLEVDSEAVALWMGAMRAFAPGVETTLRLVAYVGADRVSIAAGRGAAFDSAYGSRGALPAAADEAAADLLRRARRVVQAMAHGEAGAPTEWIWCGPMAAREDFVARAEEGLRELGSVRFLRPDRPGSSLAQALAVRGVRHDALACNLRSGTSTSPALARWLATRRNRAVAACLAGGVAAGALAGVWLHLLDRRVGSMQSDLAAEARGVGRLSSVQRGQELRMARDAVQRRIDEAAALRDLFRPAAGDLMTALLASASRQGIRIEQLEIKGDAVLVAGSSPDGDACDRLAAVLREYKLVPQIQRPEGTGGGRVPFRITGGRS